MHKKNVSMSKIFREEKTCITISARGGDIKIIRDGIESIFFQYLKVQLNEKRLSKR